MKSFILKAFLKLALVVACVRSQSLANPKFSSADSPVRNFDNLTRIEDILDLISLQVIGSQWKHIHSRLNANCAHDMTAYLSGFEEKEMWAIKSKFSGFSPFLRQLLSRWKLRPSNFTFCWGERKSDRWTKCYTLIMLIWAANKSRPRNNIEGAKKETTDIIWVTRFKTVTQYYIKKGVTHGFLFHLGAAFFFVRVELFLFQTVLGVCNKWNVNRLMRVSKYYARECVNRNSLTFLLIGELVCSRLDHIWRVSGIFREENFREISSMTPKVSNFLARVSWRFEAENAGNVQEKISSGGDWGDELRVISFHFHLGLPLSWIFQVRKKNLGNNLNISRIFFTPPFSRGSTSYLPTDLL